jgi:hypothetical protein
VRDTINIHIDELREGKPYKRCPNCGDVKEINEFGLRRKIGAGKNGADVIADQAWCRVCRSSKRDPNDPPTDET